MSKAELLQNIVNYNKKALTNKFVLCIMTMRCGDAERYIW